MKMLGTCREIRKYTSHVGGKTIIKTVPKELDAELTGQLKGVILKMFKNPKGAMSKEFMKRMSHQIENINKEIK